MKTQLTQPKSVKRSLAAMMLMAASSASLSHAQGPSGSFYGPISQMPLGGLSTPIPADEVSRNGIAHIKVTQSGALSLSITFAHHVHRQTGVFTLDESSPPESPVYVADLGETSGGYRLEAICHDSIGEVFLTYRTTTGDVVSSDTLIPASVRNIHPFYKPGAYSTVALKGASLYPDDLSHPDIATGPGYGVMLMGASGAAVFAGTLPDGQAVTGGGQFVRTFQVPMMLRTASSRDTVVGDMPGSDMTEGGPVNGGMKWVKGASPHDVLLPSGGSGYFTVATSAYTPPALGERIILGTQNGPLNSILTLYAADRSDGFVEKFFTLTNYNQALFPAPNAEKLQVNFLPALGFFTGKVKLPYTPPLQSKTVSFSGVVRQHRTLDSATGELLMEAGEADGFYLADPLPGTLDQPKVSGGVYLFATPY